MTHLELGYNFNKPIKNLPNSLTHLKLGDRFNQPINYLPNSIIHLTLGKDFNQPIDNLPNSITYLKIHEKEYSGKNKSILKNIVKDILLNINETEKNNEGDIIKTKLNNKNFWILQS